MSSISVLAPAKLNLFLEVGSRRSDGYHRLQSLVMFTDASLADNLLLSLAPALRLEISGELAMNLPTGPDNLVMRAACALQEYVGVEQGADMLLTKNIPVAAGLGGGSSDAAAALRGLERLWRCEQMAPSLALGADIPACYHAGPCYLGGAGETIIGLGMPDLPILIANPGQRLATKAVFDRFDQESGARREHEREYIMPNIDSIDEAIAAIAGRKNDLTIAACALCPEIDTLLRALSEQQGARITRMSGSGPSCFAIFGNMAEARAAAMALSEQYPHWWLCACRLEGSQPD